jgi:hypothetical protein
MFITMSTSPYSKWQLHGRYSIKIRYAFLVSILDTCPANSGCPKCHYSSNNDINCFFILHLLYTLSKPHTTVGSADFNNTSLHFRDVYVPITRNMAYQRMEIPHSHIHENTLIFRGQHCINEENLHNIKIRLPPVVDKVLTGNSSPIHCLHKYAEKCLDLHVKLYKCYLIETASTFD